LEKGANLEGFSELADYYYSLGRKERRRIDREYHQFILEKPCAFSNSYNTAKPHHVRLPGMKPADIFEIPTTHKIHTEIHTKGKKMTEKKYKIELADLVKWYHVEFWEQKK